MSKSVLILIRPDCTFEAVPVRNDHVTELAELQELVDGYIETVSSPGEGVIGIVNEEGRLRGLPVNRIGTMALGLSARTPLVGNVVLACVDGENIVGFRPWIAESFLRIICDMRNMIGGVL